MTPLEEWYYYQDPTEEDAQARVEPSGAQDQGSGLLTMIAASGPWPEASAPWVLHKSENILWDERHVVLP